MTLTYYFKNVSFISKTIILEFGSLMKEIECSVPKVGLTSPSWLENHSKQQTQAVSVYEVFYKSLALKAGFSCKIF